MVDLSYEIGWEVKEEHLNYIENKLEEYEDRLENGEPLSDEETADLGDAFDSTLELAIEEKPSYEEWARKLSMRALDVEMWNHNLRPRPHKFEIKEEDLNQIENEVSEYEDRLENGEPLSDVKKEILDTRCSLWDLGGHEKQRYRKKAREWLRRLRDIEMELQT